MTVDLDLQGKVFIVTGANAGIGFAASPQFEGVTGKYFDENGKVVKLPKCSQDSEACARLWKVSAEMVSI